MPVLLTIGEFSKMTYLSVKALRHYHDVGLLEPADIDPSSGYRRYTADQVATAQAIRRFRDLDMPIEQVRTVLQAPDLGPRAVEGPDACHVVAVGHYVGGDEEHERLPEHVVTGDVAVRVFLPFDGGEVAGMVGAVGVPSRTGAGELEDDPVELHGRAAHLQRHVP